jgi:uncharacterized damage-inducible protein DinB
MNARTAIKETLDGSDYILKSYIKDLSDEDLILQPLEGFNPIALQLGHLIESERDFIEKVKPGSCPQLPEGFAEKHSLKNENKTDRSRYLTKNEYVALWDGQRAATKSLLDTLSDAELDKPNPLGWDGWPTVSSLINLAGVHALSHVGQFVAVRRMLGKPIAF